jgi:biotin carboxyl carrier protein
MGGVVIEISVAVGDAVTTGQQVAVIEAMKMKTVIAADHDGKVTKIMVKVGDAVDSGQALMTIE